MAYTPGVAEPCRKIESGADPGEYTIIPNTVAVVTDGSAVLGLGNIGVVAEMPVMEGKAVLFKAFARGEHSQSRAVLTSAALWKNHYPYPIPRTGSQWITGIPFPVLLPEFCP